MGIEIIILIIISFSTFLIVAIARSMKQINTKREDFIKSLKNEFPDFEEVDENSLDKTVIFNNGNQKIRVFTQIDYLKTRKYTNSYNYFVEILNINKDDLVVITDKAKSILP